MGPIVSLLLAASALPSVNSEPPFYAVRNVRLVDRVDAPEVTLILRDGRIEGKIDARAEIPPGAREIDGQGWLALPAFIDAYGRAGCSTPEPVPEQDDAPPPTSDVWVAMREANRKGIQPSFRAADVFALNEGMGEAYREGGFGTLLSSPGGQLLSGASVLVTTRDAARRDVVLEPDAFHNAAFRASGPGYPSTLMGYHAQLRQLFLDAGHHEGLIRRHAAGKSGPRPPYDPELEAVLPLLKGETRILCEANHAGDVERWVGLGDELGFTLGITGGREAWRSADLLADRGIPVFLTLEWGDEVVDPDDGKEESEPEASPDGTSEDEVVTGPDPESDEYWRYEEPLSVRRERRRLWEERRDGVQSLLAAGVEVSFGTGDRTPKELLAAVRSLVEAGLPVEEALAGLTETPARMLGRDGRLGRIELGYDATLAIWTANPLVEKDAHIAWLFIEGHKYGFDIEAKLEAEKPGRGVDATGRWVFEFGGDDAEPATADLEMTSDGRVQGTIEYINPGETRRMTGRFEGRVSGADIELRGKVTIGMFETEVEVKGRIEEDEMSGDMIWKWSEGADATTFSARRQPEDVR
jgi:imidazolonepropionase-like amidohydrolase